MSKNIVIRIICLGIILFFAVVASGIFSAEGLFNVEFFDQLYVFINTHSRWFFVGISLLAFGTVLLLTNKKNKENEERTKHVSQFARKCEKQIESLETSMNNTKKQSQELHEQLIKLETRMQVEDLNGKTKEKIAKTWKRIVNLSNRFHDLERRHYEVAVNIDIKIYKICVSNTQKLTTEVKSVIQQIIDKEDNLYDEYVK